MFPTRGTWSSSTRELPSPALGWRPHGSSSTGTCLAPHRIYKSKVAWMELCLLTRNVLTSPAANLFLPGFHCPELLTHLPPCPSIAGQESQQEQHYKVTRQTSFPQKSLVQQKVCACSGLVPVEQRAWDQRSRCLQLQPRQANC